MQNNNPHQRNYNLMENNITPSDFPTILYEEKKESSNYFIVPTELEDRFSNYAEQCMFRLLNNLSTTQGYSYPSNKYIAQKMKFSEVYVKKLLKSLKDKKLIYVNSWYFPKGKNGYCGRKRHIITTNNRHKYSNTYLTGSKIKQELKNDYKETFLNKWDEWYKGIPLERDTGVSHYIEKKDNTLKSSLKEYGTQKPHKKKTDFSKNNLKPPNRDKKSPPPKPTPPPKPDVNFHISSQNEKKTSPKNPPPKKSRQSMRREEVPKNQVPIIEPEVEKKMKIFGPRADNPQAYENRIRAEKYEIFNTRYTELKDPDITILEGDYGVDTKGMYAKNGNHRITWFGPEEDWQKFIHELKRFGRNKRAEIEREKKFAEKKERDRQEYLIKQGGK